MKKRISVLGVGYDNLTKSEAVETAYQMLNEPRCHIAVTPNSEIVYMAQKDPELLKILNDADLIVPDGIGIIYASKIIQNPLIEKVAGIELGEGLIDKISKSGDSVFFLGAKPGVAEEAAKKLCGKYPGLNVAGTHDGYFKDDESVIVLINQSGAAVVFVCLGAPKQEYWMAKNASKLNARLLIGLGGSLDAYAGIVKRAPDIWVRLGLEWFYRLCKEPSRFGRMTALPKFMLAVIFNKSK